LQFIIEKAGPWVCLFILNIDHGTLNPFNQSTNQPIEH